MLVISRALAGKEYSFFDFYLILRIYIMIGKNNLNSFFRADQGATTAAPAILSYIGLPIFEAHGFDEAPFDTDPASITGLMDLDL